MSQKETVLSLQVSTQKCALPLLHVRETMRPLALQPLSSLPSYILGMALIRGSVVPVVHLAPLLGLKNSVVKRWVAVLKGDEFLALAVEDVLGVETLELEHFTQLPKLVDATHSSVIETIGALHSELFMVLEATRLLSDMDWQMLKAAKKAKGSWQ